MPFFKRTTTLFDNQLEQIASRAVTAANAIMEMLHTPEKAAQLAQTVGDLEHSADRIVRDTLSLQYGSLGASERGDLMALLEYVDDLVDVSDSIAQRIWMHNVGTPTPEALALGEVFLASVKSVHALIGVLRTLREPHELLDLCVEINQLEKKGDDLYRESMHSLFSGKHDALHVIRWKEVYERIERGINKCEDVAKKVEGLVQAIA